MTPAEIELLLLNEAVRAMTACLALFWINHEMSGVLAHLVLFDLASAAEVSEHKDCRLLW